MYIQLPFKLLAIINSALSNKYVSIFTFIGSVIPMDAMDGKVDFPVSSVFRYVTP